MSFLKTKVFCLSVLMTFLCLFIVGIYANQKNSEFSDAQRWVEHTNEMITGTLLLTKNVASSISSQRAYLINKESEYKSEYEFLKLGILKDIDTLSSASSDNPSQTEKFQSFHEKAKDLFLRLDNDADNSISKLQNVAEIQAIEDELGKISKSILNEENSLLKERLTTLKKIQDNLIWGIIVGILLTAMMLIALNYYLYKLRAQGKLSDLYLGLTQERLSYAMRATGEGVYDWDIKTNKIYFSPQYTEMIGYSAEEFGSTFDAAIKCIHKDDYDFVLKSVEDFLDGTLPQFSIEFRMLHKDGHHIWINSRAELVKNHKDEPIRMIGTHRNITNQKSREDKLVDAIEEVGQKSEAKSSFLAHMSHEIRTPLTAITGIAEILEKNATDFTVRQKELIKTLATSAKSLKDLISDILDFSKIEKGEVEFDNQYFPLRDLTSEVISIMSVPAGEKNITFKVIDDDIQAIEYFGDRGRIRQILLNLIGNAIKFTDQGMVTVLVKRDVVNNIEILNFTVQDTGIGIDTDMVDNIFKEFQQGDSSVSRKYGGTGLGLPISKNLSQLMGGDIFVESTKNLGSTFTLSLPLIDRSQHFVTDTDPDLRQKITDKLSSAIRDEQTALIVEDYKGNIVILSYFMEEIGLPFDVAKNGEEALNMWREKHYDIVLMDVQMPIMDGLTATRKIREIEKDNGFQPTPIIGMTAHALMQDKDKCIESGMSDYISKPIDSDQLKKKILDYIQKDNVVTLKQRTTSS